MKAPELTVNPENIVYVKDILARGVSRSHDLIDANTGQTKTFTFTDNNTRIPIPFRFIRPLLSNEGFEVTKDLEGLNVLKIQQNEKDAAGNHIRLRSDQVIANLDELTTDALLLRAQEKDSSISRKKGSMKKEDIITFLLTTQAEEDEDGYSLIDDEDEEV